MKRSIKTFLFSFILCTVLPLPIRAAEALVPVGQIIGLELGDDCVIVAAFDDTGSCARDAGIQIGDEILSMDGKTINCAEDVRAALRSCDGDVEITLTRGSRRQSITLEPEVTEDGPKLGIYLRQGISGIGTVTFYDPETGLFGTLGHGVSDAKGMLLNMRRGSAYRAQVCSVQKGKCGIPGQLKGAAASVEPMAPLLKNTAHVPDGQRQAKFVAVITFLAPDGTNIQARGEIHGELTRQPYGENGFGYDPIFYYPPMGKTTSEMSAEEKNQVSHRANALNLFYQKLKEANYADK